MSTKVDASTILAAQLYSTTTFRIPDFQRKYSWEPDEEVAEFWQDLRDAIDSPPYFLGLLIVTEEDGAKTVVDGQQRLITLTLLANAVQRAARAREKNLIADRMRDIFLFHLNYQTERREPRIRAIQAEDRSALNTVLSTEWPAHDSSLKSHLILRAQQKLERELERDLSEHDTSTRLASWAQFLSEGLSFALFQHPDRNAAYKVYEVVNTRGRDLTPAELIKSYLIGSVKREQQRSVFDRWTELERRFAKAKAEGQFTQFVRHVVTLDHGYVIPRDLYEEIGKRYEGNTGAEKLLRSLEVWAPTYELLIDPTNDVNATIDAVGSAFSILDSLGLRTVRPAFMAASIADDAVAALTELTQLVVARMTMGSFGTGSVERQFAEAALRIHKRGEWQAAIATLKDSLGPRPDQFEERLATARPSKGLVRVIRASIAQEVALPTLTGYVHQVRPGNGESWASFDDSAYREVGGTLANHVLLTQERRPRNTHTPEGANQRLVPSLTEDERTIGSLTNAETFTAAHVIEENIRLAKAARRIWVSDE